MDPEPFKQVAKMLWSLGNYAEIAKNSEQPARELVDACKARPGIELLDVAAGNGNVAIAAALAGASVVASELTPAMVELGGSAQNRTAWTSSGTKPMPRHCPSRMTVSMGWPQLSAPCSLHVQMSSPASSSESPDPAGRLAW